MAVYLSARPVTTYQKWAGTVQGLQNPAIPDQS
jgi:hypothetical protein